MTPFQLMLLLIFCGIALTLLGFLVLVISSIAKSYKESEELSEQLEHSQTQEEVQELDKRRRRRERQVEGVIFLGPVPVIVRGYKLAIMFLVLCIVVFLAFLAIVFTWMMGLHI